MIARPANGYPCTMTNASNEPADVGDDEAINDDAAEADEIRSSPSADSVREDGARSTDDDQDAEPSGNAPPGGAPNDPSGS